MKKSAVTFLHIGYWLIYLTIWAVVFAAISQSPDLGEDVMTFYSGVILGVAIIPAVYSFYVFYYILFPRFLEKRRIPQALLYGILVALSSFLLAAITLRFSANIGFTCYGDTNYIAILIVSFISFLNGGFAFIIRGFITWFEEIKLKEELQKKNHEMELALVKSQLDPHFLFNTLNNIDILILKNPEKASTYLNKLSDIMRFILFETKPTEIPLNREIEYISKYVELQRIRTANPNYVSLEVVGNSNETSIAPLVFIPIIENAFKHTNNKKLENAIVIQIKVSDESVTMDCVNKIDPTRKSTVESNGLGHDLISKRLKLLYPDRHELQISKLENTYSVSLIIHNETA